MELIRKGLSLGGAAQRYAEGNPEHRYGNEAKDRTHCHRDTPEVRFRRKPLHDKAIERSVG
jgi:hypothetical protein